MGASRNLDFRGFLDLGACPGPRSGVRRGDIARGFFSILLGLSDATGPAEEGRSAVAIVILIHQMPVLRDSVFMGEGRAGYDLFRKPVVVVKDVEGKIQ
jgi:hypothetical protein